MSKGPCTRNLRFLHSSSNSNCLNAENLYFYLKKKKKLWRTKFSEAVWKRDWQRDVVFIFLRPKNVDENYRLSVFIKAKENKPNAKFKIYKAILAESHICNLNG